MNRHVPLALLPLLLLLIGCAESKPDAGSTEEVGEMADPVASFGSHARQIYGRLDETPLSDSMDVQIGMFGDLNVMAGENVVMGQYRYRVDRIEGQPIGMLSFSARSSESGASVPVVLMFDRVEDRWHLREAEYVASDVAGEGRDALEQVMARRLDPWAEDASTAGAAP